MSSVLIGPTDSLFVGRYYVFSIGSTKKEYVNRDWWIGRSRTG